jgi:2-(1,2-epoxy-1,2-dihydrophenyl)acetyl-CoA isomerase
MTTVMDAGTDEVLAHVEDGVGVIVLNRPARRNALTPSMLSGLGTLLDTFERDPGVGAVMLTGAGGAFCAGGDVAGFAECDGDTPQGDETAEDWCARRLQVQLQTVARLHAMQTPTLAALPGAVAGAGLGLALACDMRVGCPSTVVSTAFVKVGLSGDFGVAWLLHRLVGPSRAARLMLLSERIDGTQAAEFGLVDWSVPDGDVDAFARNIAVSLATGAREATWALKENLRDASSLDLIAAMKREVVRYRTCADTDEHHDAVRAFVERRRKTPGPAPHRHT